MMRSYGVFAVNHTYVSHPLYLETPRDLGHFDRWRLRQVLNEDFNRQDLQIIVHAQAIDYAIDLKEEAE